MTIRELIEQLERYPDWDKEIEFVHINAKIFSIFLKDGHQVLRKQP